jgi:hypothetical protein
MYTYIEIDKDIPVEEGEQQLWLIN